MSTRLKPRIARRPQLERETPLIATAHQVIEEVSRYLDLPLPSRYADQLAHRARVNFANSASFREKRSRRGDAGHEQLYLFMRHWLAARLQLERPALFARLPRAFAAGEELPPASKNMPEGSSF